MTQLTITKSDVVHIKEALESFQAELEVLQHDNEWYLADSLDRLTSALLIVYTILGIAPEGDTDNDVEQRTLKLL